jgi:DNA-directed RNA polymerase specialized sigma24 family protein
VVPHPRRSAPAAPPASAVDWAHLLEGQVDYVYRTLQRCGAGGADIDDLLQEVFVVMCRRRASYDPDRPLRPWIVGIVFRVIKESRRRGWREVPGGNTWQRARPGCWCDRRWRGCRTSNACC